MGNHYYHSSTSIQVFLPSTPSKKLLIHRLKIDVELEAFRREEIEELRNALITEIDLLNRAVRTNSSLALLSTI